MDKKAKLSEDPFDFGDNEEKKGSDPFEFDFDSKPKEVVVETKTVEVDDGFDFGDKPKNDVMDVLESSQPTQSFDPLDSMPSNGGSTNLASTGLVFDTPAPA